MKATLIYSNRHLKGTYKETAVDVMKNEARYKLTSITGQYYNIFDSVLKQNVEIKGKRNFNNWAKQNNYTTDF